MLPAQDFSTHQAYKTRLQKSTSLSMVPHSHLDSDLYGYDNVDDVLNNYKIKVKLDESDKRCSALINKLKEAHSIMKLQSTRLTKIEDKTKDNSSIVDDLRIKEKLYREKILALEKECKKKEHLEIENENIRRNMQKRVILLENQLDSLKNQQALVDSESSKKQKVLKQTMVAMNHLQNENEQLFGEKDSEYKKMGETVRTLKTKMSEINDEKVQLKSKLSHYEKELKQLKKQKEITEEEKNQLSMGLDWFQDTNRNIAQAKEEISKELDNLKVQHLEMDAQMSSLKVQKEQYFRDTLELRQTNQRLTLENRNLYRCKEMLEKELDAVECQTSAAQSCLDLPPGGKTDRKDDDKYHLVDKQVINELTKLKEIYGQLKEHLILQRSDSTTQFAPEIPYENGINTKSVKTNQYTQKTHSATQLTPAMTCESERNSQPFKIEQYTQVDSTETIDLLIPADDISLYSLKEENDELLKHNQLIEMRLNELYKTLKENDRANEASQRSSEMEIDYWKKRYEIASESISSKDSEINSLKYSLSDHKFMVTQDTDHSAGDRNDANAKLIENVVNDPEKKSDIKDPMCCDVVTDHVHCTGSLYESNISADNLLNNDHVSNPSMVESDLITLDMYHKDSDSFLKLVALESSLDSAEHLNLTSSYEKQKSHDLELPCTNYSSTLSSKSATPVISVDIKKESHTYLPQSFNQSVNQSKSRNLPFTTPSTISISKYPCSNTSDQNLCNSTSETEPAHSNDTSTQDVYVSEQAHCTDTSEFHQYNTNEQARNNTNDTRDKFKYNTSEFTQYNNPSEQAHYNTSEHAYYNNIRERFHYNTNEQGHYNNSNEHLNYNNHREQAHYDSKEQAHYNNNNSEQVLYNKNNNSIMLTSKPIPTNSCDDLTALHKILYKKDQPVLSLNKVHPNLESVSNNSSIDSLDKISVKGHNTVINPTRHSTSSQVLSALNRLPNATSFLSQNKSSMESASDREASNKVPPPVKAKPLHRRISQVASMEAHIEVTPIIRPPRTKVGPRLRNLIKKFYSESDSSEELPHMMKPTALNDKPIYDTYDQCSSKPPYNHDYHKTDSLEPPYNHDYYKTSSIEPVIASSNSISALSTSLPALILAGISPDIHPKDIFTKSCAVEAIRRVGMSLNYE